MINAVQTLTTGSVRETGIQGLSAYEVYKKNGGTLSEEEWLLSLKGEKGDTGEQGLQGEKGDAFTYEDFTEEQLAALKGEKGDTGEKGEAGKDGANGKDGVDGQDGLTPTIGTNGNWFLGDVDTGMPSKGADGSSGVIILAEDDDATKIEKLMSVIEKDRETQPLFYRSDGSGKEMPCMYELIQSFKNTTGRTFIFMSFSDKVYMVNFIISNDNTLTKNAVNFSWLEFTQINNVTGSLENLGTEDKSNLVNAINEVMNNSGSGITEINSESGIASLNNLDIGIYLVTSQLKLKYNINRASTFTIPKDTLLFITGIINSSSKYGFYIKPGTYKNPQIEIVNGSEAVSCTLDFSGIVDRTTSQTIAGTKTFNVLPQSSITPTIDNQLVNKKYVDDAIASAITTSLEGSY